MNDKLEIIFKSNDLQDLTTDMIEMVIDENISDDILKQIPVVKLLMTVKKVYTSISDTIFLKKAMHVLLELNDVSQTEREEFIKKLDDKHDNGVEKLLMVIDKFESTKKSKIFGRICKLKAKNKIDNNVFFRLTKLIQDAYLDDLQKINDFKEKDGFDIYEGDYLGIIPLGLISQDHSDQEEIRINHTPKDEYAPEVEGGKVLFSYHLSDLGKLLIAHYDYLFKNL